MTDGPVLVWCHERGMWWGPRWRGFTDDTETAGRFPRDEAIKMLGELPIIFVRRADPGAVERVRAIAEDMGGDVALELTDESGPERSAQ